MQLNDQLVIKNQLIVEFELWGTWLDNEGTLEEKATKGNKIVSVPASQHSYGVVLHDYPPMLERISFTIHREWISYWGDKQKRLSFYTFCEIKDEFKQYLTCESLDPARQHYCDVAGEFLRQA